MRSSPAILAIAISLGCHQPTPGFCRNNDDCPVGRPFCDVAGEHEGIARTCIESPNAAVDAGLPDAGRDATSGCAAADTRCVDGTLSVCPVPGGSLEQVTCPLGCAGAEPRCVKPVFSNELDRAFEAIVDAPEVILTGTSTIDTASGTIVRDGAPVSAPTLVLSQAGGPDLLVVRASRLLLGDVEIVGPVPIAFAVDGRVTVAGHVRVRAGAVDDCGAVPGSLLVTETVCWRSAGGGGGFGARGGDGGPWYNQPWAPGGAEVGSVMLEPLRGGCPGAGAGSVPGGAVQIASRASIELVAGGILDVNGRGGQPTPASEMCPDGAAAPAHPGGGASGGGLLLEAPRVHVAAGAALVANGGAGACAGQAGADGGVTTEPATAGECQAVGMRRGGSGGSAGMVAGGAGGSVLSTHSARASGGGGGGGVGRIRVNTHDSVFAVGPGTIVSPVPVVGPLALQ